MKKKYVALFLVGILCLASLTGCGKKDTKNADTVNVTKEPTEAPTEEPENTEPVSLSELEKAGTIDGMTYTNSYINYSYTLPDGWTMNDAEESYEFIANLMGQDKETYKDMANKQGVSYISSGVITYQDTEVMDKYYLVQAVDASKLGITDAETLFTIFTDQSIQQLSTQGEVSNKTEPEKKTIGTQDVYTIKVATTYPNGTNYQAFHCFLRNGIFVFAAYTTSVEEDLANKDVILSSMKFD